ncbi:hypothetical protein [Peribacillus glennii]|uniref:Uncharacterized protein n=1 Tax=Peribacillus glennii TaxID=2303991 RepID=A0A372L7C3_9BACI|nr:hypothetical protein [Peribacillus glennii]RFU61133.1 hypothetical protein D0466_19320 [Peribacillus glennii]
MEKEISETVKYVLDRFMEGKIEPDQILALSRTMKAAFGADTEKEAEEMARQYLTENGYMRKGTFPASTTFP